MRSGSGLKRCRQTLVLVVALFALSVASPGEAPAQTSLPPGQGSNQVAIPTPAALQTLAAKKSTPKKPTPKKPTAKKKTVPKPTVTKASTTSTTSTTVAGPTTTTSVPSTSTTPTATTTPTTLTTPPTVSTVVPKLPTGPGVPAPAEANTILPPTAPSTGTTIARRSLDPLGNLPANITPQEYVDAVLGWTESLTVRRKAVDLAALRSRVEAVTASATSTAQTYPALAAYLALLGDGHSALYTPNEARSLLEGRARGFGFSLIDGTVFPFAGSPAEVAGMRDRDRLVGVNGTPYVRGMRLSTIPDTATFDLIRTDPATLIETPVSVTVTRGEVTTSLRPTARQLPNSTGADSRIGLVELPGSTGSSADEDQFIKAGLDAIRSVDVSPRCGWVLDLRRNSGGFGTSMLAGVSPLYGDGRIAGFIDAQEKVSWMSVKGTDVLIDGRVRASGKTSLTLGNQNAPIAILTSPATASAGELAVIGFAGRGGVRVFGEPTVGVTSGNLGRSYPDGSFVAVTNVYDVDRLGRVYDGPLQPDELVRNDWSKYGLSTDPVIAAATGWLSNQPACSSFRAP